MARKKSITETGPVALKGIRNTDLYPDNPIDKELSDIENIRIKELTDSARYRNYNAAKGYIGYSGLSDSSLYTPQVKHGLDYGTSVYDDGLLWDATQDDIQNKRADEQSSIAKIGNGLAKGIVLAGTTFLDGTLGLLIGGQKAIEEGKWSSLWDNDFSRAMQNVSDAAERAAPNYYSTDEEDESWYENIFTANFLGDKLIKNLGFTIGAAYSGGKIASLAKGLGKLTMAGARELFGAGIGTLKTMSKASSIAAAGIGSILSAVTEGSIEARNNSKDWHNLHKLQIDDGFGVINGDTSHLSSDQLRDYEESLSRLEEDRLKMGNVDLLLNLPVLTFSNLVQFGKLFANGFKTSKRANNSLHIIGKPGEYTSNTSKLKSAAIITKDALSEGTEEVLQKAASEVSGNYYSTDINNFYKAKTDPNASMETLSWVKSFAEGINGTINDGSTWEEFFIGTLTGALGLPKFRSIRDKDGNLQSPITLASGAYNSWKEYSRQKDRENEVANYMNNRINSPEFKNYYQGIVRHRKYQDDMDKAVENNNEFDFKNAEHAQLVSDIIMFDAGGKLNDLKAAITEASGISREDLESIVKNTTTVGDNGKLIGPFSQYAILNEDGDIEANFATQEDIDKMSNKITNNKNEILDTINKYQKIKDEIILNIGNSTLTDDQISELTWMKSQLGNWSERAVSMSGEVKSVIGNVLGNLDSLLRFNEQVREFEGQHNSNLTDGYNQADRNVRNIQGAINTLNLVRNLDDDTFAYTLASSPKLVNGLIKEINKLDESILSADAKNDIISKLNDIVKLGNASKTYNAKLKEYLQNPQKQAEDHVKADEEAIKQETDRKTKTLRDKLNAAQNIEEFRAAIEEEEDTENRDNILSSMEDEGNEMAKNYRETSQYNSEVRRVLNGMDVEPQLKQDATKLFQAQFGNSENLEQLANPNSIYINNENAFDEDSGGDVELSATRFQEAQYALQSAMSQVNNDNKFKDRFSPEYKKPVEKREGTIKGDDRKDTTGDSGTPTIPTVDTSTLHTTEVPVGNITQEMVAEENKKTNERVETPQRPSRDTLNQFYRPAIPELHIEASKEGDFRPFDVVVGERQQGVDFSGIYGYLRDAGAFRYVNEGNLKAGDELGFMIDPNFNDHTIFIVDRRNNQIVGSLDESDYSVSRYEGLAGLEERIRKEFVERSDKSRKFFATPTIRVSKVMVGRVPYGSEERSLKDIPNVQGEGRQAIFGIVKNGTLTTNGRVDDSLIIKPVDMSQKEGRLYLLIPNGAGKYSPAAVRVKHFNNTEFSLDDITVSSTPIGKDISAAVTKLANSTSQDDVSQAMQDLAQDLYMQDIMVTWFDGRTGSGIVISKKARRSDGTYEKIIINGKEQIKEDKYDVYFSTSKKSAEIGGINFDAAVLEDLGDVSALGAPKDPNDIYKEILGHLVKFNLPLQVSTRRINNGSYNNRLINSGILTSNITNASVRSTWFTTDYFDNEGSLHQAISPASVTPQPKRKVETPVGGTEGAIAGTRIVSAFSNKPYYIDLKTGTIRDDQGRTVKATDSNRILFDLAWAQDNFGSSTNSTVMVDNKVLTPNGQVLNRTTQKYITGQEAQDVKDAIAGRKKEREDRIADSKKVISEIYENQKRVDKGRTDGKFYYILEDDDRYHEYSRVHSRLGSNWVESPKQTEALTQVRTNLSRFTDNPTQFNNYLKFLENKYKISLSEYVNKTDAKSRDTIVNIVRDAMSGANSQRALNAGTAVDGIIRQYFTLKDISKIERPSNMSESAFIDLITTLNNIKSNMEQMGERFLADNIVLFQKYADGTRVAGEVDILSVDKDGNFRIYDVKTSKYSFYDFIDRHGNKVNYFENKSNTQKISNKDYYTLQLSAYKNLFESQYGVPVTKLAIMPFVLNYEKESVSGVKSEKGIPITYNPAVNVPLVGSIKVDKPIETPATRSQEHSLLPIYDSSLELQNPIEDLTSNHSMNNADERVGYFELDGKLHKGYIIPLTVINGIEVHLTKVPNITKGFGRQEEVAHVASTSYYAVFPNGKTFLALKNNPVQRGYSQSQVEQAINKMLEGNPQKVKELASEKTILFDPDAVPAVSAAPITTVETPATINQGNTQTGAAYTAQKEQAIMEHDDEFEDEFTLRRADETIEVPVWNQEKELNWLSRVLPQLSESDRVKVVKGLIKVGRQGALAWGQFDNGIITLSDIAAEGTTYHEAFHAVFNLLLSDAERDSLLNEYKAKHPSSMDGLQLEEELAEDFREFVMQGGKDTRSLGKKILDFFKSLFIKTKYWKDFRPSSIYYFRAINEGKYSNANIRVSTIKEVRNIRYREVNREDISKALDDEYGKAVEKVSELNNHRYNTENDAMAAFNRSGIRRELFYRITRRGAKNAVGHKIQLLTKEQFNEYKKSMIDREEILNRREVENWYFESLDPDVQMALLDKSWTKEKFDSISQEERDQAVKCIAF